MFFSVLQTRLAQILRAGRFDIVQLEYTAMSVYWKVIRRLAPEISLVLDELDISYVALQRLAETGLRPAISTGSPDSPDDWLRSSSFGKSATRS